MKHLVLLGLLGATACGDPISDGGGKKAPPPPKAVVKADLGKPADEWFYNPAGKRDPFSSFLSRPPTKGEVDDTAPPLQRWDTDRFVLTGVIWNVDAPRALLVDPEGIGRVVKHGMYVGRNWGKVTSISEDGVVVTEEYRMIDGELVVNPVTIKFGGAGVKK